MSRRRKEIARPPVARATPKRVTTPAAQHPPAVRLELGGFQIHVERAEDVQAVLQPLLQVASQKNLSQLLGVSTRTVLRWQDEGRLPPLAGRTLAQVVSRMATIPGSGP